MRGKALKQVTAPGPDVGKTRVRRLKGVQHLTEGAGSGFNHVRTDGCPSCREEVDLNPR
jgi:hypothetical protein